MPSDKRKFPKGGGPQRGAGRPAGVPNKSTTAAREAVARFIDANAERFQELLDSIAAGVPKVDGKGNPIPGEYLVPPSPAKAFESLQSLLEYHIPKLARTELTGKDGGPVVIQASKEDEAL